MAAGGRSRLLACRTVGLSGLSLKCNLVVVVEDVWAGYTKILQNNQILKIHQSCIEEYKEIGEEQEREYDNRLESMQCSHAF